MFTRRSPVFVLAAQTSCTKLTCAGTADTYDWDRKQQGIVLGAFFFSYVLMQIPSGRMAESFGGKWIVVIGILGSGVVNLLTPLAASASIYVLTFSRVVLGILQGGIIPACYAILFKWLPRSEKAIGFGMAETGTNIGSIAASGLGGYLTEYGFAGGWPSVFYVPGTTRTRGPVTNSACERHNWRDCRSDLDIHDHFAAGTTSAHLDTRTEDDP